MSDDAKFCRDLAEDARRRGFDRVADLYQMMADRLDEDPELVTRTRESAERYAELYRLLGDS